MQKFWNLGVTHILLLSLAVYNYGIVWGLISLIMLYFVLQALLAPLGYEFAAGSDIIHLYDSDTTPHNCLIYWEMDKIKFEDLKEQGFESWALKNIKKFSQVPVNILGFWFWKDVSPKIALNQIQKCETIHSQEELLQYSSKLINIKMPEGTPQWCVKFVEDYTSDKSLAILVFHHSFSDGNGMVNSLTFFSDESRYPKSMPVGRGIPWYIYVAWGLLVPIMFFYSVPELFPRRWRDWGKIKSPNGNWGRCTNLISKQYEFKDLKECYKVYNKTLNSYMMGIVSKSIYEWYSQNGAKDIKNICTIVPIAMKPFVKDIKKINMNNHTSGITWEFPLKPNLQEAINETKKGFDYYFSMPYLIYMIIMVKLFWMFPPDLGRFIYGFFCRNLDLTFTNVPGYKEPMYIWNK